jgi:hypothetical protein
MAETRYLLATVHGNYVVRRRAHGKQEKGTFWGEHALGVVEADGQVFGSNVPTFAEDEARALVESGQVNPTRGRATMIVAFLAAPDPQGRPSYHTLGARAVLTAGETPAPVTPEKLLEAAQAHGENNEPDSEVGDLQQLFHAAFRLLTPEQRVVFFASDEIRELADVPEYEEIGL